MVFSFHGQWWLGALVGTLACQAAGDSQGNEGAGQSETDGVGDATEGADATGQSAGTIEDGSAGPAGSDGSDPTGDDSTGGDPTSDGSGRSPGCGMPYDEELVLNDSIEVGGRTRTFILSVPSGYDPDVPLALVFAWHGLGGSGQLARSYFGVEEATAGEAIVVYPEGGVGGETWDPVDAELFDAILARVSQRLCIDPQRVFSVGHSFGGYMTHVLACSRSDVLRGVGVVAGGTVPVTCQSGRVAAWMTHGTLDSTVGIGEGERARDQILAHNNCGQDTEPTSPEGCVEYQGCDPGYPVVWCPHDNPAQRGHQWPSFAAGAMWTFLKGLPTPSGL